MYMYSSVEILCKNRCSILYSIAADFRFTFPVGFSKTYRQILHCASKFIARSSSMHFLHWGCPQGSARGSTISPGLAKQYPQHESLVIGMILISWAAAIFSHCASMSINIIFVYENEQIPGWWEKGVTYSNLFHSPSHTWQVLNTRNSNSWWQVYTYLTHLFDSLYSRNAEK